MAQYPHNRSLHLRVQNASSIGHINIVLASFEGILYIEKVTETGAKNLLMMPRVMRESIMESCHGHIMAGHLSSRKSLHLLLRQFYWWGITRDCDLFVKGCSACNRSKKSKS